MLAIEYGDKNLGTKKSPRMVTVIKEVVKTISEAELAGETRRLLAESGTPAQKAKRFAALASSAEKPKVLKGRGVYDAAFGLHKIALTKGERSHLLKEVQRLARLSGLRPEEVFSLPEDEALAASLVEATETVEAA